MGQPDRRCDVYFAKATRWRDELLALRAILLATPLDEAFKWRTPCYTFGGANVCTLGPLKNGVALGFFKGVLLTDTDGLLAPSGPNTRSARDVRFAGLGAIRAAEPALRALVAEAIANEEAGRKVTFATDEPEYPEELTEALAADPDLASAWDALTPGRRRGYVLAIAQAKRSGTRVARIAKHRARILQGLGPHDR